MNILKSHLDSSERPRILIFMTYVGRLRSELPNAGGTRTEYLTLTGWVILMLGMKIVSIFIQRPKPFVA